MKKMSFLIGFLCLAASHQVSGTDVVHDSCDGYGYKKYRQETRNSIQGNGYIILEETKVLGALQVNGNLEAKESTIHSLLVNGQAKLHSCSITHSASINGFLKASDTKFQEEISVTSDKVILTRCSLKSLIVRRSLGHSGIQVIDLRDGTHVSGPIVVESGNGEIWISSNSEISIDQVSGAQVYTK